jgi:hypothetical protein
MCMVIRKVPGKQMWALYTKKVNPLTRRRKRLGTFGSRADALRREREIQFFKRAGKLVGRGARR